MKVIDLLNKIVNGEQPKHIRVFNEDWFWNDYDGYVTKWSLSTTPDAQHYLFGQYRLDFALNKEVEIIEENNKIEKLYGTLNVREGTEILPNNEELMYKINEIIDKINEMDKGE